MMDSTHIGSFGTLSVMKTTDPTVAVAHFPIDEEETTIGRDPNCSIRLYYETVSRLHCKIIFQERKAFLSVLGKSGVIADGCTIFPTVSGPTTIPLANDTEIEVHRKRFCFTYPPKDLRATVLSTPGPGLTSHRKTLRMSMIHSAQVFSPGPSHDPQENLRTLQSPIKPRFPSPLKSSTNAPMVETDEEDIVLVDGNHPSVVQDDDDDLVILETVLATSAPAQTPSRVVQFSRQPQQYRTPVRKPRSSLHRAVLLRSAQRAAMKIELETEEAQEEMEVEEVVAATEDESASEVEALHDEVREEHEQEDVTGENRRRELGDFMTPQAARSYPTDTGRGRLGQSTEGPRRVRVFQAWKVQDIFIPEDVGMKKEEFAPVFRKERISDEERQAIRDRRKSALKIPDPADSHIPGSRTMSSAVPPSPAVFFSPKKVVEDSKTDATEEEDTTVLFEKMKAMVEDIKRRKSTGTSLSPTKGDAEGAFWSSGNMNDDAAGTAEDNGDQYEDDAEADEAEVERQTTPVNEKHRRTPPLKTPRMEGMKQMFADPIQPQTPAFGGMKQLFAQNNHATPAYGGVRDMFRNHKGQVTPKMGGLRDMFSVREESPTPTFEGIGELLATPAGYAERGPTDGPVDVNEKEQGGSELNKGAMVRKRKGPPAKRIETVSPEPQGPQRVLRNAKAASKVVKATTTLPRTRTKRAMTDGADPPRSEPPRKTRSDEVNTNEVNKSKRQPTPKVSEGALVQKAVVARSTRARPTPPDSGPNDGTTKAAEAKLPPTRRGARAKPINIEEREDVAKQSTLTGAKLKGGARGKWVETIKDEDPPTSIAVDDQSTKNMAIGRSKAFSNTPDDSSGRVGKENTPDSQDGDENELTGATAPPPAAPIKTTRARRGVTKPSAVKDEPPEAMILPRTRTTRSRR